MKGYDGPLLINYIISNMLPEEIKKAPDIIANGCKIICVHWRSIKIIDSYSFIPLPLSGFAKTFGLKELKKGFFPHLFNTPDNQNYIGLYPEVNFYQPDLFSPSKRDEFYKWYETVKNKEFNFKQEFLDYCISDVNLLTEGSLLFRKHLMESTKNVKS